MRSYLLVLLYVTDEVTSLLLPVASGMFALVAVAFCLAHPAARDAALPHWKIRGVFAALFVLGIVGSVLSGTRISPLFVLTILLLYALWTSGARLPPLARLITPDAALFGVLLALFFVILAKLGFDLFSELRGIPANRPAGLFVEPSHLALYVMPLWLIAFSRRALRPLLWACLLLLAATQFTFSMVGVLGGFIGIRLLLDSKSISQTLWKVGKVAAVVAAALAVIYAVPDLLVINDIPLATYINHRVFGFVAREGDDNFSLTPLVVVQGIEIATLSFKASTGLGVGLGSMGTNEAIYSQSPTRDILVKVTAEFESLNLRDGGILLNKLIGEVGVLVLPLLWLLARAAMRIRAMPASRARHIHIIFAALTLVLLLVRALPYFAAPTCLAILSLASLTHAGQKRRRRRRRGRKHRRSPPAAQQDLALQA